MYCLVFMKPLRTIHGELQWPSVIGKPQIFLYIQRVENLWPVTPYIHVYYYILTPGIKSLSFCQIWSIPNQAFQYHVYWKQHPHLSILSHPTPSIHCTSTALKVAWTHTLPYMFGKGQSWAYSPPRLGCWRACIRLGEPFLLCRHLRCMN